MIAAVPLHPEQVVGDDQALLWHAPGASLPVGRLVSAPEPLGGLLADGTLPKALCARGLVWLWLDPALTWRGAGPKVRDALSTALQHLEQWRVDPAGDEVLRRVSDYVLEGSLSAYIASHGGRISVVDVKDDAVEFDFDGACADCPAADVTLHSRVEEAIRDHYPTLARVTERPSAHTNKVLLWPRLRRAR